MPATALTWAQLAEGSPLSAQAGFEQSDQTYPFGCHVAVAEVDIETGEARLVRHIAVDDCGTVLNQMLVDGQVHGGVAQGVAQALYEEFVYDAHGNPLTATLVDYGIPGIGEIPSIETVARSGGAVGVRGLTNDSEEDAMTGKSDFTEAEWKQVLQGTTSAGMIIITAANHRSGSSRNSRLTSLQ